MYGDIVIAYLLYALFLLVAVFFAFAALALARVLGDIFKSKDLENYRTYLKSIITGVYGGITMIAFSILLDIYNDVGWQLGFWLATGIFMVVFVIIIGIGAWVYLFVSKKEPSKG